MFFVEVTLETTAHEPTTLVTLISDKYNHDNEAAKHGASMSLNSEYQWAVTTVLHV